MLSIIVTVGPEIVFHKTCFLNSRFGQDPGFEENLKLKDLGSIHQLTVPIVYSQLYDN